MATAAAAPPLSPIKGQQCVHGVRENGKLCKKCPGPSICPKSLSQKQFCKCEAEGCGNEASSFVKKYPESSGSDGSCLAKWIRAIGCLAVGASRNK